MLGGRILPPLYQALSRSVRRDVIPALSSVDTTAHSQQCIVPQSWGSVLFLIYWLYLKHFSHINNRTNRIRWSLSEPYTHLPDAVTLLSTASCTCQQCRYSLWGPPEWTKCQIFLLQSWSITDCWAARAVLSYCWLLWVDSCSSSLWWALCPTGQTSSWNHNHKRIGCLTARSYTERHLMTSSNPPKLMCMTKKGFLLFAWLFFWFVITF